jgi:uncharacterized protein
MAMAASALCRQKGSTAPGRGGDHAAGTRYDRLFRKSPVLQVSKILFFLLIGIAVYLLLAKGRTKREVSGDESPASSTVVPPEAMVSCAYCGLHIPTSESLNVAGRHYCGEEHQRLDDGGSHA